MKRDTCLNDTGEERERKRECPREHINISLFEVINIYIYIRKEVAPQEEFFFYEPY